jgi:hypothetical protein
MTMDRAYLNSDEGYACCCWNAPSREALGALFEQAGAAVERILQVEEMTA